MSTKTNYTELEIGLHRVDAGTGNYVAELRFTDPASEAEVPPERGPVVLDPTELLTLHLDPDAYGRTLADGLFHADNVRDLYARARTATEAQGGFLRVRLLVGPTALELHALRWELLADPETQSPLATSERTLFSRFMVSRDWRPVRLRPKAALSALVAVAAPSDAERYQLAAVDGDGEVKRARENLGDVAVTVVGQDEPLTLDLLLARLRDGNGGQGVDILYLVCHGMLTRKQVPVLMLQDEEGKTTRVEGDKLARGIAELRQPPRLAVLASCQSARTEEGTTVDDGRAAAESALAPRLADAGIPAVVAMQGRISMKTVEMAMPVFFRELIKDGQVDRAMTVARATVRERGDAWMPALYLRLKRGRIWYVPGFAGEDDQFKKWRSITDSVRQGTFVPVLGPVLDDRLRGTRGDLARALADKHGFPLAPHQRGDLAKVSQYLSVRESRRFALNEALAQLQSEIVRRRPNLEAEAEDLKTLFKAIVRERYADLTDPFRILAELKGSLFVSAGPEPLLPLALAEAGVKPRPLFGEWRKTRDTHPQEPPYEGTPDAEHPVVYYPFGFIAKPDTLVFTEDDYVDFLIAATENQLIPWVVRGTLVKSSLLFLGFNLDDWGFRVLFRLIMALDGSAQLGDFAHVGVQLDPSETDLADVEEARAYLQQYFGAGRDAPPVDIYWGTAVDFLNELRKQMAATADAPATIIDDNEDEDDWVNF